MPGDDLDRLRDILFGDERDSIEALGARVGALDRDHRELPSRLPAVIERAQQGAGGTRMAAALARPVAQALGAAVRENKQVIIDVLFPIIGPAIRKAIAEALRTLVADVNVAIESSFTPRGIRWRIEAWRSGVPYAEIALKHSLNYAIDHVFLIERGSGLVLDRESAPELPALDADAISGMLTAIGEFVRDSVGDGAGTLDSARVGEHLLWVVQGPRASLACFMRGVPPARLHALLEQRLEAFHARLSAGTELDADAAWRGTLKPDVLMRNARDGESANAPAPSRGPLLAMALVALALIGWLVVRHEREAGVTDALQTRLAAHPGFVLTGIDRVGSDVIVHGLLDPDAVPPLDATSGDASGESRPITLDTLGYVSTDDMVVARRARRLLDAPAGVTIAATAGALALGGHAPAAWIDNARAHAAWVPGVRSVALTVIADTDAAALAREQLGALAQTMASRLVAFERDVEPAPDADAALDAIVADARRAESLAATAGVGIEWIAAGTNDDPGSDAINAHLRAARARWLADALTARGIARVRTAPDDDTPAQIRQRGAFVRLVIDGAAP